MAETFKFYTTAALTTELTSLTPNGTSHTYPIYFGSATADKKVEAASDPGTDQITVTPTDANAGSGHPATDIKLATTEGGLAGATAGAALNLGTSVVSATPAVIWVQLTDSTSGAAGVDTDLSLVLNSLVETSTA